MNVLLDTCTFLWLAGNDRALAEPARRAIMRADRIAVSAVTAWELGIKHAQGKVDLPEPLETWFPRVCDFHGLSEVPLNSAAALRASRLPPIHHDPADRLLIATAIENGLTLLTPDAAIHQYPGLQTLW